MTDDASDEGADAMLSEPWTFHFPYTRTTGPVVGRFLLGLRERRIFGLRMEDGGVLVPPHSHDPRTSRELTEWVEVGTAGEVTSWTWIPEPSPQHPLDRPFGYGLVVLDGATTGMFHVIDTDGDEARMKTGMRVKVRWARRLKGHITDIASFVPVDAPEPDYEPEPVELEEPPTAARWRYDNPFSTDYTILAGEALSHHLRGLAEGRFVGMRGPSGDVLIPPDGADPFTGEAVTEAVELPDTGTVVRYCVVNIPVRGQQVEVPFVAADILLDGADSTFMAMIQGIPPRDVRLGLRVRVVWAEEAERTTGFESVKWFEPTGEPDRDLGELEEYL
ncbi:MAG: DNA-binding protein [Myxococcales bacterium]|nr:DNA-binding protein [Myxococcales bacterium]